MKLYLPDGSRTDIVAQSSPRFPVRTPEGFVELLRAQHPEPAALWRLPLFFQLQIAGEGDDVNDPSMAWRVERERVLAGKLELTGLDTAREADGDVLVFDPTRVSDGIELSDDPVLRFRPEAYSESVKRRTA